MKSISPPVTAPQMASALVSSDEPGHKAPSLLAEQSHELDELPEGVLALLVQLQPMREPELKLSIAALESGQVPVLASVGDGSLRSGKPSASKQGLTAAIDPLELPVAGSISTSRVTPRTITVTGAQVSPPVAIATLARTPQVPGVIPDTVDKSVKTPTPATALMSTPAPAVATVLIPKNAPVVTAPTPAVVTALTQASVPTPVQVVAPAITIAPTPAAVSTKATALMPTPAQATATAPTPAAVSTIAPALMPTPAQATATAPTPAAAPAVATAPTSAAVSTIAPALMPTPAPAVATVPTSAAVSTIAPALMPTPAPAVATAPTQAPAPMPFLPRLDTEQLTADTDSRVSLAPENQPLLSVPLSADRNGRGATSNPLPTPAYTHSEPQFKAESTFAKSAQSYLQVPFSRGENSGTITISKAGVEQAQPLLLNPSSTEITAYLNDSLAHIQEPRWRLADQQGHEGRDSPSAQEEDADEEPRQGFHGKHKDGRSEA